MALKWAETWNVARLTGMTALIVSLVEKYCIQSYKKKKKRLFNTHKKSLFSELNSSSS